MSDEATQNEPKPSRATRRALLIAGGTAAVGAAAAVAAVPAEAANGGPVVLGGNNSASTGTVINATAAKGGAITAHNTGAAHGSWFTSTAGNGFIGGTYSRNAQGANVANYDTATGTGTALTASGGFQTGVWAVSKGNARYAGLFEASATAPLGNLDGGGAVRADGGLGDGVIGTTNGDFNLFAGVTGYSLSGGSGVVGFGFNGVQGYSAEDGGVGMLAQADGQGAPTVLPVALQADAFGGATDAIHANGAVRVVGDLFVDGTIHTNHAVDTAWVPGAVAKVRRRAGRAATKARTSLSQG